MNQNNKIWKSKKIIHIDMDSFYASIEVSEKPFLKNKPVAVGGKPNERGVLTTCNYIARRYGIHSAMSSKKAISLCKDLIILPADIQKYKTISKEIFKIFKCYSKKIEPISIDEAFIDVTDSEYCRGNPEEMATQMRACILKDFKITASAGISSNKLISKICSDLKKPNNQYSICDDEIPDFIKNIRLNNIPGIGKVNFKKCKNLNMEYCKDMYKYSEDELIKLFGVYGSSLYNYIRGIDNREVNLSRVRKSISVEDTFLHDLTSTDMCNSKIIYLFNKLMNRCKLANVTENLVKEIFIKIKFNNFQTITRQSKCNKLSSENFIQLFSNNIDIVKRPIRLLGIGFTIKNKEQDRIQYDIFNR